MDPYSVIGVSPSASGVEVEEQLKFLMFAFHPDRFQSVKHQKMAHERLLMVIGAKEKITNNRPTETFVVDWGNPKQSCSFCNRRIAQGEFIKYSFLSKRVCCEQCQKKHQL